MCHRYYSSGALHHSSYVHIVRTHLGSTTLCKVVGSNPSTVDAAFSATQRVLDIVHDGTLLGVVLVVNDGSNAATLVTTDPNAFRYAHQSTNWKDRLSSFFLGPFTDSSSGIACSGTDVCKLAALGGMTTLVRPDANHRQFDFGSINRQLGTTRLWFHGRCTGSTDVCKLAALGRMTTFVIPVPTQSVLILEASIVRLRIDDRYCCRWLAFQLGLWYIQTSHRVPNHAWRTSS